MPCVPGDNFESIHTGGDIDYAVSKVPQLENQIGQAQSDISSLENRTNSVESDIISMTSNISSNSSDIADNKNDVDDVVIRQNNMDSKMATAEADILANAASIATMISDIANNVAGITDNKTDILSLANDIAANAADIAALSSNLTTHNHDTTYLKLADTAEDSKKLGGLLPNEYAKASGNPSIPFKVGDAVATDEAINLNIGSNIFADINGSSLKTFDCANPVNPTHSVNLGFADARYMPLSGSGIDADTLDGIDSTGFLLVGATAADSAMLGGVPAAGYATTAYATTTTSGLVRRATASEAAAGIETTVYMTPKDVADYVAAHP